MTLKNWNISEIEAITERQAMGMALESMVIKGHNVYFVDFGGSFGYSCLVFFDGHHIHYANDYALHHPGKTVDELRAWYVDALNGKLFTEEEIAQPIKDYDELRRKSHFLHNYYIMRTDYISMFHHCRDDHERDQIKRKIASMTLDPIGYAYVYDADFAKHHVRLMDALTTAENAMKGDFEYWVSAFVYEMRNHEYAINWQGDWDTLGVFGNIDYVSGDDALNRYFDQLGFNDTQRKAYHEAKRRYHKLCEDNDWF